MKRVVQYNRQGKAIAVYDSAKEAAKATGIDINNIVKSIMGWGNKYIFNTYFEWEVTNKELREARLTERKQRQAQKLKELEKEFHFNDEEDRKM